MMKLSPIDHENVESRNRRSWSSGSGLPRPPIDEVDAAQSARADEHHERVAARPSRRRSRCAGRRGGRPRQAAAIISAAARRRPSCDSTNAAMSTAAPASMLITSSEPHPSADALVDGVHHRDGRGRRRQQSERVETEAVRPVRVSVRKRHADTERDETDRDVDVEDEAPREVLHEPAAEHGPDRRREQHRDAEDPHDPSHVLGPDRSHDDGHADRHQHAAAESLQHAEERPARAASAATPHAIDASVNSAMVTRYRRFVPKRSRRPSGHRNDRALREHVPGHDPRDVRVGAGLEVGLQRRDRDVDDRRVEDRHDRAEQHDAERDPLVVEASGARFGDDAVVDRGDDCGDVGRSRTSVMRTFRGCPGSGQSTILPISADELSRDPRHRAERAPRAQRSCAPRRIGRASARRAPTERCG